MKLKTPLFMTALFLACCGLFALSYWTPGAQAQDRDTFCEDHEEEFEDGDFGEDEFEDEDWEDEEWGMEEAMFEVEIMNRHLDMYLSLVEIINGMSEMTNDGTATALMALHNAKDMTEEEELVEFLESELQYVKDVAIRRAIRLQLAETYAHIDESEKAREHLSQLLRGKD